MKVRFVYSYFAAFAPVFEHVSAVLVLDCSLERPSPPSLEQCRATSSSSHSSIQMGSSSNIAVPRPNPTSNLMC